jgi:hypothetical protein
MGTPTGYDRIKELARQLRTKIPDLLALSRHCDPFFGGQPTQLEDAEWFAALWRRFGYTTGVHLRRVHYQLVSQHRPCCRDGRPYENTLGCWARLADAGKAARYLRLVPADAFEDHRNPDPWLFRPDPSYGSPSWSLGEWPAWSLPSIQSDLARYLYLGLPAVEVEGYLFSEGDQPYHLEVWVEKSTMDDILGPLCRPLGINVVPSKGYQSITAAVNLLQRVRRSGKPARIFYISDFDPAGDVMPVAVARQLEFWLPQYAPGADVKLNPIVLTREQVKEFNLPRTPIKDNDRRKAGFEERYGDGAVELDALEALHPGQFARIVREAVAPYRDTSLAERFQEAEAEARQAARKAWQEATADVRKELADIQQQARTIVSEYEARLADLDQQLQRRLAPLAERLASVRHAGQEAADTVTASLPDRPEDTTADVDESDWLFDSSRSYEAQLAHYKAHKQAGHTNGEV